MAKQRFIWPTYVAVEAETVDEAEKRLPWNHDTDWIEIAEGVEIMAPSTDAPEVEEIHEAECTCPPDLLERGGFKGGCPVHA